MEAFAPLLTPSLLGLGLYFVEYLWASLGRRLTLFLGIAMSSFWNILSSPYSSPMLNFLTGLGSAWYIIWSGDMLFIQDPRTFERLQIHAAPKEKGTGLVYNWQSIPGQFTLSRIFWVLDLVTNLRELGWRHGLHQRSLPPLQQHEGNTHSLCYDYSVCTNFEFLIFQMKRSVLAYLFMGVYEQAPFPAQEWLLGFLPGPFASTIHHNVCLWAWVIYIYSLLESTHSIICLIGVGLLGRYFSGTLGQPWMYPPIFGPAGSFFATWDVQAFWGQWWHNVFRRSLLSIPRTTIHIGGPKQIQKLVRVWVSFALSASFHAAACYCALQNVQAAALNFWCFCLQPVPILVQQFISQLASTSRPTMAFLIRCTSVCIGFSWMSWTLPLAVLNPAVISVQETFHISADIRVFS